MRLDKYLCDLNIASRKELKKIIKSGCVTVNGKTVYDSAFHVSELTDIISYNGRALAYNKFVYYMLNKPSGVVSATQDNIDTTVVDLLKKENIKNLFPVGRLDKDTTGLLILTNDGELAHKLTSPSHHVSKKYYVKIEHSLSDSDICRLESGIELTGDGITKPAKVETISESEIYLTITEGKYHQVKRMLAAVGNQVIALKRISMGKLILDPDLSEGCYRLLSNNEIEILKQ